MASVPGDIDRRAGLVGLAASLLGPALPAVGRDRIVPWQETVFQEHEDRLRQIRQLSRNQLIAPPQLYTALVGRADLPAPFATDIPVLRVVFDQRVFFDTDRDALRPEGGAAVDVVAETLRRGAADTAVFVAGHTDSRGSDAHNYFLSVRRAERAAVALSERRVPQTNIWRIGFGKAVPLYPNTSDENMARNRRVEFVIGRKAEAVAKVLADQRKLVCASADPVQRRACLDVFDRLPPVGAAVVRDGTVTREVAIAPVVTGTDVVPRISPRDLVEVGRPDGRDTVGPGASPPTPVAPPATVPRQRVEIKADEPVVIDLRESRVLVERLDR